MDKISRFVFNFRNRCNMNCPYCYIPFVDPAPGDLELWKRIIDRLAQYSPDIITFGGGDPFAQKDFVRLLEYCRRYDFQVHVDTNAIRLPLEQMAHIGRLVDVIGVPLDGDGPLHDALRSYRGHHDIVRQCLDAMAGCRIPAKINTVLFPEHPDQLLRIARELQGYPNVKQWFIYEYWHFEGINDDKAADAPDSDPADLLQQLKVISRVPDIHYSSVSERSPAYLFISSMGNMYTIAEDNVSYIELGNVLTPQAEEVLSGLRNLEQINARAQLKKLEKDRNRT